MMMMMMISIAMMMMISIAMMMRLTFVHDFISDRDSSDGLDSERRLA